ncbi:MAG: HAMP domain-containing histidine kinase [Actinomycetales bacterium]|nr:HAMP domain-containing histidine kinase [Actinomycetales bacterium]
MTTSPVDRRSEWLGPVGRRLAIGSMLIAMTSVVALAVATVWLTDSDITSAGNDNERTSTTALVSSIRTAYARDHDWKPSDLSASTELAQAMGLGLTVRVHGSTYVSLAPPSGGGPTRSVPVKVNGQTIATATISFPASGLLPEEVRFRHSIEQSLAIASGLALIIALATAIFGSRWLVRPLRSLTLATRRLASGDHSSRATNIRGTGEVAELAMAFNGLAEKLEHEDHLRRTLVADLAHELRTPLSVLKAQIEGISLGVIELDQHAVTALGEEVEHVNRLVEDLSVLSSAEAAGLALNFETVDLARVTSNAAARLAPRYIAKGVNLEVQFSPAAVKGDPNRLEQIAVNLLSNAVKFTPPGGTVWVRVWGDDHEGVLTVTDTGRGIPEDEQRLVFDRFFRGASARDTPGSGIGLAVASSLVHAHQGTISIESSPGSGSTFTVRLPRA